MSLKTLIRRTLVPAAVVAAVVAPTAAQAAEPETAPTGVDVFIDHVQTGEHLTPNGFSANPTFYVDLWEDHNNVFLDTEKWVYEPVNGGYNTFRIRNAGGNNICLEPDRVEYRKYVSTKTCSSSMQQWWSLWDTDTGVRGGFTIRPYTDTGLAITPNSVPTGNDHATLLSPVGDYMNQVFRNRIA